MEASQRKLSAVVLLLLAIAAEMGPAAQADECFTESSTWQGFCLSSKRCREKCLRESRAYSGGRCHGILRCNCITECAPPATMAAPTDQSVGAMGS